MNTAITTTDVEPARAEETFVYHSGERKYMITISSRIGRPKIIAMGSPRVSLLKKLLCSSLFSSQYLINFSSSDDNILQK